MDEALVRQNRFNILEILRSIAEQNTIHLQETCALAFGQVGRYMSYLYLLNRADHLRILKDDEFNIVLVKLVEYLGHSNPIASGVAFNEVRRFNKTQRPSNGGKILTLANTNDMTVERMFKPF